MEQTPTLPVAISYIGSKYLVFDINVVTWIRKVHHICGVMGGTLPQAPSQNVFLGLPVQIMPEEAQLLVDKGVGYIVDDARAHDQALLDASVSRTSEYITQIRQKGEQVSIARREEKEEMKRKSLKKPKSQPKAKSKSKQQAPSLEPSSEASKEQNDTFSEQQVQDKADDLLFDTPSTPKPGSSTPNTSIEPHNVIPTTSDLWLTISNSNPSKSESIALLPNVPSSYNLYKHLNSKAFFMTPGLRFGCQYCVYPGDPLRFHSHFLAVGTEWDEEIDLMSVVGGGRLGTGVKKGYLIGGKEPGNDGEERVRTFSIEWAAM